MTLLKKLTMPLAVAAGLAGCEQSKEMNGNFRGYHTIIELSTQKRGKSIVIMNARNRLEAPYSKNNIVAVDINRNGRFEENEIGRFNDSEPRRPIFNLAYPDTLELAYDIIYNQPSRGTQ